MARVTLWLHLTSLAAYFGATLAFVLVMLPTVERIESHEERLRVLAAMLRRLNPLLIGVLGVLVMTGAFSLTAYKARLRGEFFTRIGEPLTLKLVLAFFFINGVTYVAFGLAHRIVRAVEWGDPVPPERLASMVRRMRAGSIVNLALAAWIVWVALAIPAGAAAP
ncbi:MAG: hypothetical protein E6J72_21090 [Deltaproteobacteria bacterium]|nr:MAG: hypothetical protein E6J72_21090 [Deltaproteobacteria bacterium]